MHAARPTPIDLIYNHVYKSILAKGHQERIAKDQACWAFDSYKKSKGKPKDIMDQAIRDAKKRSKARK